MIRSSPAGGALEYYRGRDLTFAEAEHRREFEAKLEQAARILESEPTARP